MNIFSSLMKPKNKYSLENLKYLHNTLVKNPTITPQNKGIVVETLRQIAEVLIWGDQNNNSLFEFFLEKNLLGFFVNILEQKTSFDVTIQLLQTLSILVENLRTQHSIYFLLSNNFINEIIIHKYDFSNEEVLDYYISFLKALSLKLDQSTINFFFNGMEKDFPLYTEAIKFINHKETMIRIAVRTLTLNVFKVEDDEMRSYIINSTAVPYFSNIVWFIRQQCATMNKVLEKSSHDNVSQLNYYMEELTDQFYYLHDIFHLGFESMNKVLTDQFIQYLIYPLLIGSLLEPSKTPDLEDRLTPSLALYLLAQVFHIFTHKPLLDRVASALVSPLPSQSLLVSTTTSVTAPPPLSLLGTQRTHYNSFRRFSSFPSLEQLDNNGQIINNSPKKAKRKSIKTNSINIVNNNNNNNNNSTNNNNINTNNSTTTSSTTNNNTSTSNNSTPTNNQTIQPTIPQSNSLSSDSSTNTPINLTLQKRMLETSNGSLKLEDTDQESNQSSPPTSPRDKKNRLSIGQIQQQQQLLKKSDLSSSIDSGSTNLSLDSLPDLGNSKKNSLRSNASTTQKDRNEYKEILLQFITNDRETFGVVCMLYSFLKNSKIDQKILETGGVLPYRLAKAKKLLEGLLSPTNRSPSSRSPAMSSSLPSNMSSHHRSRSESYAQFTLKNGVGTNNNSNNNNHNPTSSLFEDFSNDDGLDLFGKKSVESKISLSLSKNQINTINITKPKEDVIEEEEEKEFIPVPDSYQKEYTRLLIERLFFVLLNSNRFRLVTLQMTLLLLKELVYSPESPSKLTENQLIMLEEAYAMVANNLKDCLVGNQAPIFLELFEEEIRLYRQIIFESLIKDVALILPVPETPISRLSLARRLPSSEVEKTQKAIQQFLVLRELKFTLLRKKDNMLPLKQPTIPKVREKDLFNLDTDSFDIIYYSIIKKNINGAGGGSGGGVGNGGSGNINNIGNGGGSGQGNNSGNNAMGQNQPITKVRNAGVLYHNLLLAVDLNNIPPQSNKPGIYGLITHIAPLQRLEIEVSHLDPTVLRVFSHPTTWGVDMAFEEESRCQAAKLMLERARDDVRASKMRQIYNLLGERDPDDDDDPNALLMSDGTSSVGSGKPLPSRVIVPIDASNSHPLAFSEYNDLVSSRKLSNSKKNQPINNRKQGSVEELKMEENNKTKRFSKENIFLSFLNDTDDTFLKESENNQTNGNGFDNDVSLFNFNQKNHNQNNQNNQINNSNIENNNQNNNNNNNNIENNIENNIQSLSITEASDTITSNNHNSQLSTNNDSSNNNNNNIDDTKNTTAVDLGDDMRKEGDGSVES